MIAWPASLLLLAAAGAPPTGIPLSIAAPAQPIRTFKEDELLLLSVTLDGGTLTETLAGYGEPGDPFIPIAELARLLELDVTASAAERKVTGSLGEARRLLVIDLGAGLARVGGRDVAMAAGDVGIGQTDVYVRLSLLEKLLPIRVKLDAEALQLGLTATEPLPIQERANREGRRRQLDRGVDQRPILKVASPYELLAAPSADIALETGYDSLTGLTTRRYDVRLAGDVLNAGFSAYLGSDTVGKPSTARIKFERRSPEGGLLGPIGATYAAAGDVFTPLMTVGPRSTGGRGFSFTTVPLGAASVFQRITLRGELPIGYEAELYINDVLRSGQRVPVQGRYEFLDVPLSRGLNVLRIVIYGPQGDRTEQTRLVNVGGGELARGQTTLEVGVLQQDRAVIELKPDEDVFSGKGRGQLRAVAKAAYGLRDTVTIAGGVALYTDYAGRQRQVVTAGARGSLFGVALLADYAKDFAGGTAASLGAAGRAYGVAVTARHVEYNGSFVDENNNLVDGARPLARFSALDLNFSVNPFARGAIPVTLDAQRTEYADGGTSWIGFARASSVVVGTLVSTGLDYRSDRSGVGFSNQQLTANIAASRFLAYTWQLRASADFKLTPRAGLNALSVTADRSLSDRISLRLGLGRSFGSRSDLDAQAGLFFRLPFADLSLNGDYAIKTGWRMGLRLAVGLVRDPFSGGVRLTRPGVASGGSVAFSAFMDANANGQFDAGEAPVAGVAIEGGERKIVTGADGRAFVTGLGDSAAAVLHVDKSAIDAFFVSSPPQDIEFAPRAGRVLVIPYPLSAVGEVFAHVWITDHGRKTGLAAVRLRLLRESAEPIETITQFDGSAAFENVRPGTYRLELDADQAKRLGMRIVGQPTVTVRDDGGATEPEVEVRLGGPNAV